MANEVLKGLGFHHIGLKASDFDKSFNFYSALGMKCVVRWGEGVNSIAMFDLGDGGRIELFANGGDEFSSNGKWIHFAMKVDDVYNAFDTAIKAGAAVQSEPKSVTIKAEPSDLKIDVAFVKGPDGEILEFFKQLN